MIDLEAFLARTASEPFAWGLADCSLWVADWIVANGYPDPAAHLRGTYADEMACAGLLRALGGLERVFVDGCTSCGLRPLTVPLVGAVGVIGAAGRWQWGAIRHEKTWLVRWGGGVVPFRARARVMWAV